MRIVVVTDNYPSANFPTRGVFVYYLVQELCNQGAEIVTVVPEPLRASSRNNSVSYGNEQSMVIRPLYIPTPHRTLFPGLTTAKIGLYSFTRAVKRVRREISQQPDVIYAHFLYPGGFSALALSELFGCPAVVALGESRIARWEKTFGLDSVRGVANRFARIVAVSKTIRNYCVDRLDIDPRKVAVLPNAVDTALFYPRDRSICRQQLGLPADDFIISFVGHFNERKGPRRVLEAIKPYPHIKAFFIGNGDDNPTGPQVLFAGPVKHSQVPYWLGSADLFVLPTLAEGACNALNEALAMGLPAVISDIPELREQVDETAAVFVNPMNTKEIGDAIYELSTNQEKRLSMAARAIEISQERTLTKRANRILDLLCAVVA